MIDFNGSGFFARLKMVDNNSVVGIVDDFLSDDEIIIGYYKNINDGVIFTTNRIIAINMQEISDKKNDFASISYNKITTFTLETAEAFDSEAELEIYMSAVGKVKFEFIGSLNLKNFCKIISTYDIIQHKP